MAIVAAAMRKLLHLMDGILKNQLPFDPILASNLLLTLDNQHGIYELMPGLNCRFGPALSTRNLCVLGIDKVVLPAKIFFVNRNYLLEFWLLFISPF